MCLSGPRPKSSGYLAVRLGSRCGWGKISLVLKGTGVVGVESEITFAEFDHILGGDPGRTEVGNTVPGCVDFGARGRAVDIAV